MPSHSCTFPVLSPVQPCGYSIALVLVAERSDAVKSKLCCRQLSSSTYHWFCSVLQELYHVQSEIKVKNNNIIQILFFKALNSPVPSRLTQPVPAVHVVEEEHRQQ